mmetsp:Transcript_121273/g.214520  ORF Transcript_121273/g.214520 Transcript_121273/m.214520 type:complete len:232 (-) Transcript_121273:104-799(-)
MARTQISVSCLLFLSLCGCVHSQAAVFDEDEVQGLEMLQIKGHVESRNCPMPDVDTYKTMGKGCFAGEAPPGEDELCLANDEAFQYLEDAWKACGRLAACGAVMQMPNGEFRLRRASDPDTKDASSRLYMYNCKADKNDGEMVIAHKHDQAQTELQEVEDEEADVDALSEDEDAMRAHHSHAKTGKAMSRLQDLEEEDVDVDTLAEEAESYHSKSKHHAHKSKKSKHHHGH